MTFFLGEKQDVPRRGPNVALPANTGGIGAAFRSALRDNDLFLNYSRAKDQEATPVAETAGERIGVEGLNAYFRENNPNGPGVQMPDGSTVQDFIDWYGADLVLEAARNQPDQEKFADLDITREGVEARAVERQKAEDAADSQLVALSPNPLRNSLVGGLAAGVVDPINLAAIPFGLGGGSILRTMAREALINGAIEGIQNPRRVEVAERLGKEAPGLVESVATGMAFGAAFGGVLEAIPKGLRALSYYNQLKRTTRDPTLSPVTQEAAIQSAEKAIVAGQDPLKAVRTAVMQEPAPARAPLVLDDSMRVTPEPTALAPDPITTAPLEPVPGIQSTTDQIVATAKSGLAKAEKPRKEVLGWLKRQGVDPEGWLGAELKARGLTHKSFPGLFKKGGLRDADNIVADEIDPAVSWKIERAADGTYLDRDSILRALDEDIGPTQGYGRTYDPRRAYADPEPEERGLMIDLNGRQFAEPDTWRETLAADVDAYLEGKGITLLPRERDEVLGIAGTRGGDVEDLVYSAMSREIDEAEMATIRSMRNEGYAARDVPWGDEAGMGAVPDRPGGSLAGESQAAAGNAPEPGARGVEPQIERTDIGDQYVVPGTRSVDDYQKHVARAQAEAKALQSKMRSGRAQERVEDDAGGLFGGAQRDMFSDPADPKSKPTQVAMMEDLRDAVTAEDFMVDVGNGPVKASTLLRELDDDLDFEDILNACGKRGPA